MKTLDARKPPQPDVVWPPACSDCIYWEALPEGQRPVDRLGRALFSPLPNLAIGRCRANPPALGNVPWPFCYGDDWCGQFSNSPTLTPMVERPTTQPKEP